MCSIFASFWFRTVLFAFYLWFLGESCEPAIWEAAEAVRHRRSIAAEERSDEVREMAQNRTNSEEEEDSQAEAQGSTSSEPVHQDTRQEPRYNFLTLFFSSRYWIVEFWLWNTV